jgi:hypothetical protein
MWCASSGDHRDHPRPGLQGHDWERAPGARARDDGGDGARLAADLSPCQGGQEGHYRAGPQGLRPAPGPSWQGSCRAAGRATPRLGPRYMRTRIRWPRRSRTPSRCSRPRQLAQDHLRPGGLKELLRHLLGRLDALLLVRGHVILSVWELMQQPGDLRDRAAALRWSGDSAAHGGFSCRHHRPNTCCCGFTGEPFDPSTPLLSSPPRFGRDVLELTALGSGRRGCARAQR